MILQRRASRLVSCLALPFVLAFSGCSSLKSIAILPVPGSQILTGIGQTAQYTAFGQSQIGNDVPTTVNVTTSVTWSVSNPSVASINSAGLATAVGAGLTQVTAESGGFIATSDLTVTLPTTTPPSGGSGGGSSSGITINVSPAAVTETFTGETTQFIATGNLTGTGTPQNLTNQVQWISSNVQVATISAGGLATATGAGTTTITAQSGGTSATSTLTVSIGATTPIAPGLLIIPGSVTDTGGGVMTQFVAIGNLSGNGAVQNLTNAVTWISSDVQGVTVTQGGLATSVFNPSYGTSYSATITAIGLTTSGSVVTASVNVTVLSATTTAPVVVPPVLSVYELGTGTGSVTTTNGTAPLIACGNGGTVCGESFTQGAVVTLTASPATGSTFAGWTSNCTVATPTSCTITMSNNTSVGATFN
jgi:hypothetical protein